MTTYDVLLSYDINSSNDNVNSAVKDAMRKKGHSDRFTYNKEVFYLPNTNLWKKNIDVETAIKDIRKCVEDYNALNKTNHTVERGIATPFSNWWALYGKPYTSVHPAPVKD